LIVQGGEVGGAALSTNIANAKALIMLSQDDAVRGVAALKWPQISYRSKLRLKTGVSLQEDIVPYELGYVFIDPAFQGKGLSHLLVAEALRHAVGQAVFATARTDNPAMRSALVRAGFEATGNSYAGRDRRMLGLLIRPSQ
jgi:RimJ/RimL family protein N-acetyltransferase